MNPNPQEQQTPKAKPVVVCTCGQEIPQADFVPRTNPDGTPTNALSKDCPRCKATVTITADKLITPDPILVDTETESAKVDEFKPKHPGGRPLKYKTVEEIQPLIDKYFQETEEELWTITGLALALDTSRETLINYEGRGEFFDTIKKAKEMVHNAYEKDLRRKGRSGDIFALKNFGWKDKTEVEADVTSKGEAIKGINYIVPNGNNNSQANGETASGISSPGETGN